jgi:hypothetical protein
MLWKNVGILSGAAADNSSETKITALVFIGVHTSE